ncbi:MAG: ATP-binding cassette domain-containing protein, partial [Solirubrobacteraceae bacterium]
MTAGGERVPAGPASTPVGAGAPAANGAPATAALDPPGVEPPPVEVRGLVKRYGELTAVAGVDLTVRSGDVYGYLGPNGAGKTTSLRMML